MSSYSKQKYKKREMEFLAHWVSVSRTQQRWKGDKGVHLGVWSSGNSSSSSWAAVVATQNGIQKYQNLKYGQQTSFLNQSNHISKAFSLLGSCCACITLFFHSSSASLSPRSTAAAAASETSRMPMPCATQNIHRDREWLWAGGRLLFTGITDGAPQSEYWMGKLIKLN